MYKYARQQKNEGSTDDFLESVTPTTYRLDQRKRNKAELRKNFEARFVFFASQDI